MGAATNQAAEEGYRVVRNGRISACNSAPGVGTSPQDAKKASRNLLSRLALRMSGRLDSNQRPPEPHSGALAKLRHAPNVSASLRTIYGSPENSFYTVGAEFATRSDPFAKI